MDTGASVEGKRTKLDPELFAELEQMVEEKSRNPWDDTAEEILRLYYGRVSYNTLAKMLAKYNPDVKWCYNQVRSKVRRMGLVNK